MKRVHIIDPHTEGGPTRLILDGFPELPGVTIAEQCKELQASHDQSWCACMLGPRGHDVLVDTLYCAPESADASFGVILFNNDGYLGMCDHDMIGVVASLHHQGLLAPDSYKIDTPAGLVDATLHDDGSVTARNVPSYRYRQQVPLEVPGYGLIHDDIAWGVNWFFLIEGHGQLLTLDNAEQLTYFTWAIRQALEAALITGENAGHIDHIELFTKDVDADSRICVVPWQSVRPLPLRHRHQCQAGLPCGRWETRIRRYLGANKHMWQPI